MKKNLGLLIFFFSLTAFAVTKENGPDEFAKNFYQQYLNFIHSLKGSSTPQKHFQSIKKQIGHSVSKNYWEKYVRRYKHCGKLKEPTDECDRDNIYCAQEAPTDFKIQNLMSTSKKEASLDVNLCFNCGQTSNEYHRIAHVQLSVDTKNSWKIESINCQ